VKLQQQGQRLGQKNLNRSDHVWVWQDKEQDTVRGFWVCCLCGAITRRVPVYPTPDAWEADKYLPLDDAMRLLCPLPQDTSY
jgi:hypothetical protein